MKQEPAMADDMDKLYVEGDEPGDGKGESIDQEEAEEMSQTAIVPMKALMGPGQSPIKKGDEIVVEVVDVHGEDAEIKYSTTKPGEIGEGEGGEDYTKEGADKEIDEMNEAGAGHY